MTLAGGALRFPDCRQKVADLLQEFTDLAQLDRYFHTQQGGTRNYPPVHTHSLRRHVMLSASVIATGLRFRDAIIVKGFAHSVGHYAAAHFLAGHRAAIRLRQRGLLNWDRCASCQRHCNRQNYQPFHARLLRADIPVSSTPGETLARSEAGSLLERS